MLVPSRQLVPLAQKCTPTHSSRGGFRGQDSYKDRKSNRLHPSIRRRELPVNGLLDVVDDGRADFEKQATGEWADAKTTLTNSTSLCFSVEGWSKRGEAHQGVGGGMPERLPKILTIFAVDLKQIWPGGMCISSSYLKYGRCDLIDIITFLYFSMCYNYFDLSACHIT